MSETALNKKNISIIKEHIHARLPCRGCTVDCKSYNQCEGLLWRVNSTATSIATMDKQKKASNSS